MKTFYFFILFALLSLGAFGQADPAVKSDYQEEIDRRIANLDKSQIPSGILYDRVVPLSRLDVFNQRAQPDTSFLYHFRQAHYELYNASYAPPAVLHPDTLLAQIAAYKEANFVPVGVLSIISIK